MPKRLFLLALALFILAACGGEEPPAQPTFTPDLQGVVTNVPATPQPTPVRQSTLPPVSELPAQPNLDPDQPAFLRFIQANAGLDVVDIYANGAAVAARFRYGNYSSNPVEVPSGTTILRVMPAGRPPSSREALFEGQFELSPNQNLVVYLFGSADSLLLETYDTDVSPLADGQSRLYVIHAIPNGPGINVLANEQPVAEELIYGEQTTPTELAAGDYTLDFVTGGNRTLASIAQTLAEKQIYTLVLTGDSTTDNYETIVFREKAIPQSAIRLVHASYDTPPVRLLLDGEILTEDFDYQSFTPTFITVESGRHQIRVEAMDAQAGDSPLLETDIILNPDEQADVLLYDRLIDLKVGAFPIDTDPAPIGQARLSIIYAYPIQPNATVQIPTAIGTTTEFSLAFGDALHPQLIFPGAQSYQFLSDGVLINRTEELVIEPTVSYTYIVMGRRGDEGLLLAVPVAEAEPQDFEAEAIAASQSTIRFVNGLSENLTIQVKDEIFEESLSAGNLTAARPAAQGDTPLVIQNSSGRTRLEQTLFIEPEQNLTVYIVENNGTVEVYPLGEPEAVYFEGLSRVRAFNGLFNAGAIYPSLQPLDEENAAQLGIDPASNDLVTIGNNPVETGQAAVLDVPAGNYLLVVDSVEGERLHEEQITVVADVFYELVIVETGSGLQILKIPREVN